MTMSAEQFDSTVLFTVCEDAFTEAELDSIERYGDGLAQIKATLSEAIPVVQYDGLGIFPKTWQTPWPLSNSCICIRIGFRRNYIQLTDPSRYEGLSCGVSRNRIETAPQNRGTVIAFPAYVSVSTDR